MLGPITPVHGFNVRKGSRFTSTAAIDSDHATVQHHIRVGESTVMCCSNWLSCSQECEMRREVTKKKLERNGVIGVLCQLSMCFL